MLQKRKPHQRSLDLLTYIINIETQSGHKSINQLHKASEKYMANGSKISRDTISTSLPHLKDVIVLREQNKGGWEGARIISRENYDSFKRSEYVDDAIKKEAHKIFLRSLREAYPTTWQKELEKTHKLMDRIVDLNLDEKQRLHTLLNKFIKLEKLQRLDDERKYKIVEKGQDVIFYDKASGKRVLTLYGHNMSVRDTGIKVQIRVPEKTEKKG